MSTPTPATILLVDDVPENISVLYNFLLNHDYRILIAQDGGHALEVAATERPDIILLDVMMPGLSGFEVCQRLKSDPATRPIPVVFMTALAETTDKLKGFELGAVDYVTKPIQQEEVLARLNAHLTIRRLQQELTEHNRELSERNQELDAFAHTVAHDLKNPLGVVSGFSGLLLDKYRHQIDPDDLGMLEDIFQGALKASQIVESLLLLAGTSKHNALLLDGLDMAWVVGNAKRRLKHMLEAYAAHVSEPESWPFAYGYAEWVEAIWVNYISNALKYGGHPPRLELGASEDGDSVRFWVRDNGPGLSPEQQAKLFTPFTRLHREGAEGHGLGLSIVRRIAEKLGGVAGVESRQGEGSVFYFSLPKQAPPVDLSQYL